jgi:peptide/nickel transport system substrate-binding protein
MRKVIFGLCVVVLILFLSGCQKIEEFKYSGNKGGILIIAVLDEPSNLNPIYPSISGLSPVTAQLFTPLISEKPDGKVRPALAESWVYSEDLKSITYTIAKGATWHDGKPVTAEDVVFTVEQILNNKNESPLAQKLVYVESVEALNSRQVRFNLKQVFAGELQSTNIYPVPKHILAREDNIQSSDFNVEPVASGPFKLKDWNKGKWIEMVANPDYFRGRPPLDRMVFYTPSSMGELLSELSLGDVDVAYDLPPGNYDTLQSYLKVLTPGRSYTYVGWNLARFPDKKLRQAFSIAIDRRKIISDVLGNYGQVVDGPITPEHWAYNPELKGLREDKEASKKIIEELGYSKKRGQKFYQGLNVQILVEEGNDIRKKVAASIVADLQAVGVQAGIVPLSGKDLLTRLFNKNFDAYILGWNVEKEFNPFQIWGSEGIYNFVGYKNPRVDNLIGEALLSLDREKAKKALYEFQDIIREDLPYTFLYAPKKITLVKKDIQGITQDDKRPILSFVDELWFRSVPGTSIELASLGEKYRKGPVEETKPAKGTRETPEQVLMATASTLVPEKKPTTSKAAGSAGTTEGSGADTVSESSEPPKFVAYEVPPKPLNLDKVEFPYPEVAKKLGLSGTVFLELWISKDGNVTNVIVIRSVHPILDKVAVDNARQLRFSPAIQGNKPVAVRYSFPVRFQE